MPATVAWKNSILPAEIKYPAKPKMSSLGIGMQAFSSPISTATAT